MDIRKPLVLPARLEKIITIGSLVITFFLLVFIGYHINWPIYDWLESYQPRVMMLLQGQNPYTEIVYVPPWFLMLLAPLAILPAQLSNAVIFAITIAGTAWMCWKVGVKPFYLLCLMLSYPFIVELHHRQWDWLIVAGSFLPPWLGLFLVLAKPQAGIAIAVFWAVDLFRKGGVKEVIKHFAPVTIAYLISFAIYGPYIFKGTEQIGQFYNDSLWPFSIPIGLFLIYWSIKKSQIRFSIAASPFLSPYLAFYTWFVTMLGLTENRIWFAFLCLATYLVPILSGTR